MEDCRVALRDQIPPTKFHLSPTFLSNGNQIKFSIVADTEHTYTAVESKTFNEDAFGNTKQSFSFFGTYPVYTYPLTVCQVFLFSGNLKSFFPKKKVKQEEKACCCHYKQLLIRVSLGGIGGLFFPRNKNLRVHCEMDPIPC
jgi:hypothetical protein